MEETEYPIPSDEEIAKAQEILGITFHPDYIDFIKSGYNYKIYSNKLRHTKNKNKLEF